MHPQRQHDRQLAEAVRNACLHAAQAAFMDAAQSGLCYEGACECAVGAIRSVDLDAVIATLPGTR